jgi:hypothetical protein
MKKLILSGLCVVLGFTAMAQKDTTSKEKEVEIKVGGETMTFNADAGNGADLAATILKVTGQMMQIQQQNQKTLQSINKKEAAGEISAEEAEAQREALEDRTEESMEALENIMETWGDSFEESMEAWGEEYEATMEAWEEAAEAATANGEPVPPMPPVPPVPAAPPIPSISDAPKAGDASKEARKKVIIDEDGVRVESDTTEADGPVEFRIKEKDKEEGEDGIDWDGLEQRSTQKIDRTESYFDIHFGFNQNLEEGQYLIEDVPGELDLGLSTSFNLGLGYKTRIGSPYSKLYVKYGVDFSWHNFRLNNNQVLDRTNQRAVFRTVDSVNFDKSKYHTAYFNVPLMLQLDFSEVGDRDESWTLGLGGYGGVRINSKRELEYSSALYDEVEEKTKDDFYTSRIRYGVMAQVGYGSFKVTATYDLNPFFRDGKGPSPFAYNMLNLTVGFTL